jgi:hypothetical protein
METNIKCEVIYISKLTNEEIAKVTTNYVINERGVPLNGGKLGRVYKLGNESYKTSHNFGIACERLLGVNLIDDYEELFIKQVIRYENGKEVENQVYNWNN